MYCEHSKSFILVIIIWITIELLFCDFLMIKKYQFSLKMQKNTFFQKLKVVAFVGILARPPALDVVLQTETGFMSMNGQADAPSTKIYFKNQLFLA